MADHQQQASDAAAHKAELETKQFGQENAPGREGQHNAQTMKEKAGAAAQAAQKKVMEGKDRAGNALHQAGDAVKNTVHKVTGGGGGDPAHRP